MIIVTDQSEVLGAEVDNHTCFVCGTKIFVYDLSRLCGEEGTRRAQRAWIETTYLPDKFDLYGEELLPSEGYLKESTNRGFIMPQLRFLGAELSFEAACEKLDQIEQKYQSQANAIKAQAEPEIDFIDAVIPKSYFRTITPRDVDAVPCKLVEGQPIARILSTVGVRGQKPLRLLRKLGLN